jgi:hypothetical protein
MSQPSTKNQAASGRCGRTQCQCPCARRDIIHAGFVSPTNTATAVPPLAAAGPVLRRLGDLPSTMTSHPDHPRPKGHSKEPVAVAVKIPRAVPGAGYHNGRGRAMVL